jgi:glucose-6-phosphate isomerase
MTSAPPPPTDLPAWKSLLGHAERIKATHMRDLFAADAKRFQTFSVTLDDLLLDYSKNRIDAGIFSALVQLAREAGIEDGRARMMAGEPINQTEGRSVLHVALRNFQDRPVRDLRGRDVMPEVRAVRDRMRTFTGKVLDGTWRGATGKIIADVVNIGIGGSDLGPAMATLALAPFKTKGPNVHFVSNIDDAALAPLLASLDPATTLFIVASKSFTTEETLLNARAARDWTVAALGNTSTPRHFVAVSANVKAAEEFGIEAANVFEFWDWVGGRFSLWSAVGLPIALAVGYENFESLLKGAEDIDRHFVEAPLDRNMPVIMALIEVWNTAFLGIAALAVLPYDQNLARLPAYFQQQAMESNGKSVTMSGQKVAWPTAPVLFGEPGTNGQHAFYQMLHQGTQIVAADFLAAANSATPLGDHHQILLANCLAQTEALMLGKTEAEARAELAAQGLNGAALDGAVPHRLFAGNRPSNTLLYKMLDPRALGRLIALYEHKVFVAGMIWRINSFDQWGVELGKKLARALAPELAQGSQAASHDSSTEGLIGHIRRWRGRIS